MPDTDALRFDRIDTTAPRNQLLAIADRDRKVYRATLGDAYAIIEPDDGTLRIPYVQAEGDTRMHELLDAVVDAVGMDSKRSRRIRFVCIDTDDEVDRALRDAVGMGDTPSLTEVVHGGERVDEEWSPDTHDVDEAQTVPCLDVEWSIDR